MKKSLLAAALVGFGSVLVAVPAVAAADPPYANCSEARADGAAPIHKGDPGYSSKLDRDGDGIACE